MAIAHCLNKTCIYYNCDRRRTEGYHCLSDNACRTCSKFFGVGSQCVSCHSYWRSEEPLFDQTKFADLPQKTIEALKRLDSYVLPQNVLSRLCEKHPYSVMTGRQIHERIVEFKKFIAILVINQRKNRRIEMISEEIDEVWHTFILFTREYHDFCNMLLCEYIHHDPNVVEDKNADSCAIRNYRVSGVNNFHDEYRRYFGELAPVWNQNLTELIHEQEYEKRKYIRKRAGLVATLVLNAAITSFLAYDLSSHGISTVFAYNALAYLPILIGGIVWTRLAKESYSKRIIAIVVLITFVTLLGSAVIFTLQCQFSDATKSGIIFGFSLLFLVSGLMFHGLRAPRSKKFKSSSKSRCGGGAVGIGCGSGGGGCGGGGCGGGGC